MGLPSHNVRLAKPNSAGVYVRHRPETTLLYQVVQEYWPEFQAELASRGKYLPAYVTIEFDEANSVAHLKELLAKDSSDLVTATVQKFQENADDFDFQLLNPSDKIIVLADEAHRTQYGTLGAVINTALPNAPKIAFTGTPLIKSRKTNNEFGTYIDTYTIEQAVRDGATVQILYEGREARTKVTGDSLNRLFDAYFGEGAELEYVRLGWRTVRSRPWGARLGRRTTAVEVMVDFGRGRGNPSRPKLCRNDPGSNATSSRATTPPWHSSRPPGTLSRARQALLERPFSYTGILYLPYAFDQPEERSTITLVDRQVFAKHCFGTSIIPLAIIGRPQRLAHRVIPVRRFVVGQAVLYLNGSAPNTDVACEGRGVGIQSRDAAHRLLHAPDEVGEGISAKSFCGTCHEH